VKADPKVIGDLLASCGQLATIAEQYRLDGYALRNAGLKDLGRKFYAEQSWHQDIETHLNLFIKQLLNFESDPNYTVGPVATGGDVSLLLRRNLAAIYGAFNAMCERRAFAWDTRADAVPDLYEHAIKEVQHQINKIERYLRVVDGIGVKDFVGALVEV